MLGAERPVRQRAVPALPHPWAVELEQSLLSLSSRCPDLPDMDSAILLLSDLAVEARDLLKSY